MNPVEILERALERTSSDVEADGHHARAYRNLASAARQALAALDAEGVGVHIEAITQAVREDKQYAISWHANIAMAFQDEGGDHATANRAAARFMQQLFGVDTSPLAASPAPEPAAQPEEVPLGPRLEWVGNQPYMTWPDRPGAMGMRLAPAHPAQPEAGLRDVFDEFRDALRAGKEQSNGQ
jgi:hypothetical protein